MTDHVHEWELLFKLDSFRRVRCKHCSEQMLDYDIERRLNATERNKNIIREATVESAAEFIIISLTHEEYKQLTYADTLERK